MKNKTNSFLAKIIIIIMLFTFCFQTNYYAFEKSLKELNISTIKTFNSGKMIVNNINRYSEDLNITTIKIFNGEKTIIHNLNNGEKETIESYMKPDGTYRYKCYTDENVFYVETINNSVVVSNDKGKIIAEYTSLIDNYLQLDNNLKYRDYNSIQLMSYGSWTSYTWNNGHMGFWVGITLGVISTIISSAMGLPLASSIIVSIVAGVVAEGVTDIWYSRGTRYKFDYDNECYMTGVLMKLYSDNTRKLLIDMHYQEYGPTYWE